MRKRVWTLRQRLEITAIIYAASLLCNVGLSTLFILAFLKPALNDAEGALQCQRQLEQIRALIRQQRPLAEGDIAFPATSSRYLQLEDRVSDISAGLRDVMSTAELQSLWEQVSVALREKKAMIDARRSALAVGDGSQFVLMETKSFVDLDRLLSELIGLFGSQRQASIVRATQIQWWVVGTLLANTVLGVTLSLAGLWFVRKWVVLPVTELRRGTEQLSRGDFSTHVTIQSSDEMGDLGREVNQMAGRIAEMQHQLVEQERRSAAGEMVVHLEENLSGRLADIRGLARTTGDGNADKNEIVDFQRRIGSTTESLENWLRDLRKIVLPSEPQLQHVRIEEMVSNVNTVLQPILDQSQVQLRTNLDPRIDEVQVDRLQFEQAIIVLVTNAVEASKPGHTVEIAVTDRREKPMHWQLTVTDEGTGIPADLQERVFLPFFTTKPHGNGIGLGLVKAIIESHGGTLSLRSNPGVGTRFCAVLPIGRPRQ
jgi:signal transduction histidine kinase